MAAETRDPGRSLALSVLGALIWVSLLVRNAAIVCSFYVAHWLDLVLHETAHALVARLFGHAVLAVYIGAGRRTYTFSIGLCDVHVAPWPIRGRVVWAPRHRRLPPVQALLVIAAGPCASAALVGLAVLCTRFVLSHHVSMTSPIGTFLAAVTVTSSVSFVGNLWPTEDSGSDGSKLLETLRHGVPASVPALCAAGLKRGLRLCDAGEHRRGRRFILRNMRDELVRKNPLLMAKLRDVVMPRPDDDATLPARRGAGDVGRKGDDRR